MTNYNPKNIETQLELPGMETASIETIASASPKTKQKRMGLKIMGYSIIGALALAIGAASYGGYQIYEFQKNMKRLYQFFKGTWESQSDNTKDTFQLK